MLKRLLWLSTWLVVPVRVWCGNMTLDVDVLGRLLPGARLSEPSESHPDSDDRRSPFLKIMFIIFMSYSISFLYYIIYLYLLPRVKVFSP